MGSRGSIVVAVPGLAGGVDEAVRHLFGSPAMRDRWDVRILTTKGQNARLAPFVFARALLTLAWWRVTGRVDVLHLNVSFKGSTVRKVIVGAVARALRIRYVVQVHSGGYQDFYDNLPAPVQAVVRSLFTGADHVFVLGRPFQELVEGSLGVPAERVSIVRNAVDIPALRPDDDEPSRPPALLFTGRLWARKGVYDLLDALGRIDHLPWSAVLVGDGEVQQVTDRVAQLGLTDRISVRSWQTREEIDDLLASSSVFVHPSYVEALSVSLLEAMAAGLCCLATEVGAHGEILADGENALVVVPGDVDLLSDRLAKAVGDADLRDRLGRQARATAERLSSTEVVAAELSRWYQASIDDGAPAVDGGVTG